jgi:hypothetical protein
MRLFCIFCFTALLSAQEPGAVPTAEQAQLAALLPMPASFGFKAKGAARFYSSDLNEYTGSGAEVYRRYGFTALVHQEYRSVGLNTTVDIYDMSDPLKAFGVYSTERHGGDRFVEIGGEGYERGTLLNYCQGQYYVKISMAGDYAEAPILEAVGKYVSRKILTGVALPKEIAWFPSRGLTPHSHKYVISPPLGFDFLAPAATAQYRFNDKETKLLVSIAASPVEAAERVARLQKSLAKSGAVTAVAGMPTELWRGSNRSDGEMVFFAQGRYTVVLVHPPAQLQAFVKELVSRSRQ